MCLGATATGKMQLVTRVLFNTHEKSGTHKMAVECLVTLPTSYRNVGDMLSSQYALDKQNNRDYLLKVFQNIQFLARKGIAIRGDLDESEFYAAFNVTRHR